MPPPENSKAICPFCGRKRRVKRNSSMIEKYCDQCRDERRMLASQYFHSFGPTKVRGKYLVPPRKHEVR